MKCFKKLLFFILFLTTSNCIYSQIKVYPYNKVHVGPIWSTTFPGQADECLFVNEGANFSCIPAGLIPILTEAIKKQSEEIDSLKSRIQNLEHH